MTLEGEAHPAKPTAFPNHVNKHHHKEQPRVCSQLGFVASIVEEGRYLLRRVRFDFRNSLFLFLRAMFLFVDHVPNFNFLLNTSKY